MKVTVDHPTLKFMGYISRHPSWRGGKGHGDSQCGLERVAGAFEATFMWAL
jgi:hypothetical protein